MKPRLQRCLRLTAAMVVAHLAFAAWASSAHAYATWSDGCIGCHGDFNSGTYVSQTDGTSWGTNLMSGHGSFMGSGTCNVCHQPPSGTPRSPVFIGRSAGVTGYSPISCLGCHGRAADASGACVSGNSATIDPANCGMGAGLRAHHADAGVTDCADCHSDAAPVGENAFPVFYFTPDTAHPNKPVNPCNAAASPGNENKFGLSGLDNDGDGLYDQNDPDCQVAAVCGDGNKSSQEDCDDGNTANGDCCSATCHLEPSTMPCRAAAGVCDLAEFCTGTTASCPANAFAATTTTCRASAGACDVQETCTGSGASCPGNSFAATTMVCRAAISICDAQESCAGTAATCPADAFAASTTVCRGSTGICDVPEACTGSSGACPGNSFAGTGTVCRASGGVCDADESCTGASAACPADVFFSSTTACRTSSGACDAQERCSGTSATCPADTLAGTDTTCRTSSGECDLAESCNGIAKNCPADVFVASDTACSSDGNVCTNDICNGSSAACRHPANSVACNDGLFCNGADTCSSGTCSIHAGDPCPAPDGDANCAESCDEGVDACTAADPDATACNDGDSCTMDDACTSGSCAGVPDPQCSTTTTTLAPPLCGDANDDGKITASDALIALRTAVGTANCSTERCDYNGDGEITASDALAVLRRAVGQEVVPNCSGTETAATFVSSTLPVTTTITMTTTTISEMR